MFNNCSKGLNSTSQVDNTHCTVGWPKKPSKHGGDHILKCFHSKISRKQSFPSFSRFFQLLHPKNKYIAFFSFRYATNGTTLGDEHGPTGKNHSVLTPSINGAAPNMRSQRRKLIEGRLCVLHLIAAFVLHSNDITDYFRPVWRP